MKIKTIILQKNNPENISFNPFHLQGFPSLLSFSVIVERKCVPYAYVQSYRTYLIE